ncbi:hypothetical protein F4781DRAFT_406033 [Annulohypoxylon bovei var. microspora]|nr:hypothetical protein F4781DRAFT_406033 [Annulohypoxylon bovei var. microspora]
MTQNDAVSDSLSKKAPNVAIEFPHISLADDESFTAALADLVNAGYGEAEAGIFKPGYLRTSASDIAKFITAGDLVVASVTTPKSTSGRVPLGCISIKKLSENRAELGLFAVVIEQRGSGIGRDLMDWAEQWCLDNLGGPGVAIAQLDLLFPTHFAHPFKARLDTWYTKRGYRITGSRDFALDYPSLAPLLAGPTEYRVYERTLV